MALNSNTEKIMKKSFITYLTAIIVILVTGSVTVLSTGLYLYITSRLEFEFNENMNADKERLQLIISNRLADLQKATDAVTKDNTVRFTAKSEKFSELEERLKFFMLKNPNIYFYMVDNNGQRIIPKSIVSPLEGLVETIPEEPIIETVFQKEGTVHLVWQFHASVADHTRSMGTVYALYDLLNDRQLMEEINHAARGRLLVEAYDRQVPFTSLAGAEKDQTAPGNDILASDLPGFAKVRYAISQSGLIREKQRLLVILIAFTLAILAVSSVLSLFLGRQMSRPLAEMARKAIRIPRGRKDMTFSSKSTDFVEFLQLSKAFNYMLENLKEAEEKARFTELLENVDDAVYLTDENGRLLNANEATYKSLNYAPHYFFGLTLFDILPMDDAQAIVSGFKEGRATGSHNRLTMETHMIRKDRSTIPVEIKSRKVGLFKGNALLFVARDMTQRMEAERVLRESEAMYRSLIETSHNGILILDENFRILYANNRLCRILGYSRKALDTMDIRKVIDPAVLSPADNALAEGTGQGFIHQPVEITIPRPDLDERHCFINTTAISDAAQQNTRTVVQILDITDQYRAEQEKILLESHLRQSQKMEAIGNLAGGIAHDFNNLLQIIHGYTEILIVKKDHGHPDYGKLSEIKQAAQRATELTRQLLTFSRKVESVMRPADLNYEVIQIHKLLKRTIPQMIEMELKLADTVNTISADTSQLGQLLMNLGVNAKDAMPDGGKITIETRNVTLDPAFCESPEGTGAVPGDYVCLSVSDTGTGMSQQCLEHIYEPFYTTKDVGKGTGLGLAIVYGIINSHKGHIVCKSEEGCGTRFDVYLPALDSGVKHQDAEKPVISMSGSETILLVDDDEQVRQLGCEMLASIGHTVIPSSDGENALALYQSRKNEIDLVMLDLLMPGMGGHKCLEKLLEIDPDAKVLIASGHSGKNPEKEKIESKAMGYVSKPFKINEISQTIRQIIDHRPQ